MRIRTITCHDVGNYGASLQAYSLMRHLQGMGHDVKIIDYLPDYKPPCHSLATFYNSGRAALVYRYAPWLKPLMAFWQNRRELRFQKRRRAFDAFKARCLDTTERAYRNNGELAEAMAGGQRGGGDLDADLYIAGSDQIWNPYYGNGLDPAYYCAFVADPSRCISYAASFGKAILSPAEREFIRPQLANFRALSVRETTGVEIARSMGYDACQVVDPVFLTSREDWERLAVRPRTEGYVLVYDFLHNDPRIERLACALARERGLKIVAVNDKGRLAYADRNVSDAGPAEFLGYIRNASHVVAASFHAAAFSVIFERDFYIFPMKGHGNSSRMTDFLRSVGLERRFIDGEAVGSDAPIDFAPVRNALATQVDASKQWLASQVRQ